MNLFLGDSVATMTFYADKDKRTLEQMVQAAFPETETHAVGGYDSLNYLRALEERREAGKRYNWIMLGLNLRMFSPQWEYYPRDKDGVWDMAPPQAALKDYRNKHIFDRYSIVNLKTISEGLNVKSRLARLAFHYGYDLKADDPMVVAMKQAVTVMEQISERQILYFTPIDWQVTQWEALSRKIWENMRTLEDTLERVDIADFTSIVPSECFADISEHLRSDGRLILLTHLEGLVAGN